MTNNVCLFRFLIYGSLKTTLECSEVGKNYFKRSLGKQVTQNEFKLVEHVVAPDQGTQLV